MACDYPREGALSRAIAKKKSDKFVRVLRRYEREPASIDPGDAPGRVYFPFMSSGMTSPAAVCVESAYGG